MSASKVEIVFFIRLQVFTCREEECHGMLEPIGLEINNKKGYVIIFKCKKCGQIRRNKAAEDDNMDLIISLSVKE